MYSSNGKSNKHTYMWTLYLKVDAVTAAIRAKDADAISIIRGLLMEMAVAKKWFIPSPDFGEYHGGTHVTRFPLLPADRTHSQLPTMEHYRVMLNLSQTQANMLLELLKRGPCASQSMTLYPRQAARAKYRFLRFGENSSLYFDLLTGEFIQSQEVPVPTPLPSPLSIICSDIHLRLAVDSGLHLLPVLSLMASFPLERPKPLPCHVRPWIPSRATLIVTTRTKLAHWEAQARKLFSSLPKSVIVLDNAHDYQSVSWHDIQLADVVIASDKFMFGTYDRALKAIAVRHNTTHDVDYAWADPRLRQYADSAMRHEERNRERMRELQMQVDALDDVADWDDDEEDFELNLGDGFMPEAVQRTEAKAAPFVVQDEAVQRLRRTYWDEREAFDTDGSSVLLHLVYWHRLVFDGVTRATRFEDVLAYPKKGSEGKRSLTPLRELCASSTITISLRSKLASVFELYSTLSLRLCDSPPSFSVASRMEVLDRVVLNVKPEKDDLPSPEPKLAIEIVACYPSLIKSARTAVANFVARDSLATCVHVVQHHHVPYSAGMRTVSGGLCGRVAWDDDAHVFDSKSTRKLNKESSILFAWELWNHLAVYRSKRGWPLFDDWFGPERNDRRVLEEAVDDWTTDQLVWTPKMLPFQYDEPRRFNEQVHGLIRKIVGTSVQGIVEWMRTAMSDSSAEVDRAWHAALKQRLGDKVEHMVEQVTEMYTHPDKHIFDFFAARGLTPFEIVSIGYPIPDDYEADADSFEWMHTLQRSFTLADDDADEYRLRSLESCDKLLIREANQARVFFANDKLRQQVTFAATILDPELATTFADDIASESQEEAEAWARSFECALCDDHPRYSANSGGYVPDRRTWRLFGSGASGCNECMADHSIDCEQCSEFQLIMGAQLALTYSPADRYDCERTWETLLAERGLLESVARFCLIQEHMGEHDGPAPTNEGIASTIAAGKHRDKNITGASAFTRVFGAKIQAVVMYILQELEGNPAAKFVAFTEYQSQQHLLGLALHIVGAELVLDGGASEYPPIHSFNTDPSTKALIMPFTKCQDGVNLTAATHIVGNASPLVKLARFVIPRTREAELVPDQFQFPAGFTRFKT